MKVMIRGFSFEMDPNNKDLIDMIESELEKYENMSASEKLENIYALEDDLISVLIASTIYAAQDYSEEWVNDQLLRYQNRLNTFNVLLDRSGQKKPPAEARYANMEVLSLIELFCRRVEQLRAVIGGIQKGVYPAIDPEETGKIIALNEKQMKGVLHHIKIHLGEKAHLDYKKSLDEIPMIMAAIIEADKKTTH
jgi:hypothetical protein